MNAVTVLLEILDLISKHHADNHGESNDTALLSRITRDVSALSTLSHILISATPLKVAAADGPNTSEGLEAKA